MNKSSIIDNFPNMIKLAPEGTKIAVTVKEVSELGESELLINHPKNRNPETTPWPPIKIANFLTRLHINAQSQERANSPESKEIYEQYPELSYDCGSMESLLVSIDKEKCIANLLDGGHRTDEICKIFNLGIAFPEINKDAQERFPWYSHNLMGKSISEVDDSIIEELADTRINIVVVDNDDWVTREGVNSGMLMSYQQQQRFVYKDSRLWEEMEKNLFEGPIKKLFVLKPSRVEEQAVAEALWITDKICGNNRKKKDGSEKPLINFLDASDEQIQRFVAIFDKFYTLYSSDAMNFTRRKECFVTGKIAGVVFAARNIVDENFLKEKYKEYKKTLIPAKRKFFKIDDFRAIKWRNSKISSEEIDFQLDYAEEVIEAIERLMPFFFEMQDIISSRFSEMSKDANNSGSPNNGKVFASCIESIYSEYQKMLRKGGL